MFVYASALIRLPEANRPDCHKKFGEIARIRPGDCQSKTEETAGMIRETARIKPGRLPETKRGNGQNETGDTAGIKPGRLPE